MIGAISRRYAAGKMPLGMQQRALLVAAGLLAAGLGIVLWGRQKTAVVHSVEDMRSMIARNVAGWEVRDVKLGSTDAMERRVAETLRFDAYEHRVYRKGSRFFSIYAGYWGPRRIPTREIAGHTPDICWIGNGMELLEHRNKREVSLGGVRYVPAEWRRFRHPEGQTAEVCFWLLTGGEPYDFGQGVGLNESLSSWFSDVMRKVKRGGAENIFVRVVTYGPWAEYAREEGFATAMRALAGLGLEARR